MTYTPQPAKRRRRLIVAAFVLMFASLCTWWFWSRADTTFIGKWSLDMTVYGFTSTSHIELSDHGQGTWKWPGFEATPDPISWEVNGNTLAINFLPRGAKLRYVATVVSPSQIDLREIWDGQTTPKATTPTLSLIRDE